jgi:hypothetical protein
MGEEARAATSARMSARNPLRDPDVRARATAKIRTMGVLSRVRGGAGTGLTVPQRQLSEALGWPTEVVVPTGCLPTKGGLPTHYRLDIAHPTLKLAIEVDGNSHYVRERREQDQRRDAFLRGEGWTVLRFWNREVTDDLVACVRTVMSTTSRLKVPTPTRSPEAS